MSVTYGFYNSINGDRKYNATQMAKIFDGLITDGVFASIGTKFGVVAYNGLSVKVGEGRAWFNHTWTLNDADIELTVEVPNMVYPRIDTVVLEIDTGTRVNSIKVISGIPAVDPVPPTLTNNGIIYQHPLANISVPVGLSSITESNISILVGSILCPYVTGILQTINIDILFSRWEADFLVWFNSIKDQLSEDAAGALQLAIDALEVSIDSLVTGWFPAEDLEENGSVNSPDLFINLAQLRIKGDILDKKVEVGMRVKYEQTQRLTAYWSFDATATENLGENGIVVSSVGTPTYTSGKIGNALTLNGVDQALSISDNDCFHIMQNTYFDDESQQWVVSPKHRFTIGAWIKRLSSEQGGTIFYVGGGYGERAEYYLGLESDGHIVFNISDGINGSVYVRSNLAIISPNVMHSVVLTYNRGCFQLYIDNLLDTILYATAPSITYSLDQNFIRVGCFVDENGINGGWFGGQIDELFFIKEYALDQGTIGSIYDRVVFHGSPIGTTPLIITKMGIVVEISQGSNDWLFLSIWSGIDYSLISSNTPVENLCFSRVKFPTGFNPDPRKWRIQNQSSLERATSLPYLSNTPISIEIPKGKWKIHSRCYVEISGDPVNGFGVLIKLKGAYHPVLPELSSEMRYVNSSIGTESASISNLVELNGLVDVDLSNEETFDLLITNIFSGTEMILVDGSNVPTLISATCPYL